MVVDKGRFDADAVRFWLNGRDRFTGDILFFSSVDSTNNAAREAARKGYGSGTAVIADSQTSGRGRLGRSWHSSPSKGIWMSVLLKPESMGPAAVSATMTPAASPKVSPTISAAVAAAEGIEKATGIRPGIKWPNDLMLDGRKVCGILTEGGFTGTEADYVIIGIGVNVFQERADFPDEIADLAVSLKQFNPSAKLDRAHIAADILTALWKYCMGGAVLSAQDIIGKWKESDITLGKNIRLRVMNKSGEEDISGIAEDICEDGGLLIRTAGSGLVRAVSGEVTICRKGEGN